MTDQTSAEVERLREENHAWEEWAANVTETPTQVAHPWRATLRTILAAVLAAGILLPTVLPIVTEWAAEQAWLPSEVSAAVAAVTAVVVAVAGLITRLLAIPGVNAWLARYVPFLAAD